MNKKRFGLARQGFAHFLSALLFVIVACPTAVHAQLNPGDVLVAAPAAGTRPGVTQTSGGRYSRLTR